MEKQYKFSKEKYLTPNFMRMSIWAEKVIKADETFSLSELKEGRYFLSRTGYEVHIDWCEEI